MATEACTGYPLERVRVRVAVFVERLWGFGVGNIVGFTAPSGGCRGNREKGGSRGFGERFENEGAEERESSEKEERHRGSLRLTISLTE